MQYENLKLKPLAIGSLPHDNVEDAMKLVEKDFAEIPFPPQLVNVSKNEDMIIQLLEGMPLFSEYKLQEFVLDTEKSEFFEDLETFFTDYEEIISDFNSDILSKYGISDHFSHAFSHFKKIISDKKPSFAKAQITGPFTFGTSLNDKNGSCIIYDETLREICVKLLSLKVLWIIKQIKSANKNTVPIIFMDEPSISQLGTSAYMSISCDEVISMLREISDLVRTNGGISAIHCCGKCDWRIPIKAGVDIINFDAYNFSKNFSTYHSDINKFLQNGGKIAWGLVPTLDGNILEDLTVDKLTDKFKKSIKYLTKSGIDAKLITDNSLITSSCGAGSLTVKQAQRAMDLVKELSQELRKIY